VRFLISVLKKLGVRSPCSVGRRSGKCSDYRHLAKLINGALMVQSVRLSVVTVSILLFARRTLFAILKKIPNSHRPTRRDETVSMQRVDSGGANWP